MIKTKLIESSEVLALWEDSPQSTAFTHPQVISKLAHDVKWWLCEKGNQPLCLWPVALDMCGKPYRPSFTYWVGPCWTRAGLASPEHRRLALETQVYQSFMQIFIERYGAIVASLPIGIQDVRVFDWWNYHDEQKSRIQIWPRYTAVLGDLGAGKDVVSRFRALRRREVRRAEKDSRYLCNCRCSVRELSELYAQTLERSKTSAEWQHEAAIESLVELVDSGHGILTALRDIGTELLVSAVLILIAKGTANVVLNLVHNNWRNQSVMPLAIYRSIMSAIDAGCTSYDFNGANSPRRGDDKHSYGGAARLYFDIAYKELDPHPLTSGKL